MIAASRRWVVASANPCSLVSVATLPCSSAVGDARTAASGCQAPDSGPAADGSGETNGCEEVLGEAVVSRCDPAEVLDASEHTLDGIAVAVQARRESALP